MSKLKSSVGAGIVVILMGALMKRFAAPSTPQPQPERKPRRPRVPKAELYAAYERAARDPAYMEEARETARAWDRTSADGLPLAARTT